MFDAIGLMERAPDEDLDGAFGHYDGYRVQPSVLYPLTLAELVVRGLISQEQADLAMRPHDVVYAVAEASNDYREVEQRSVVLETARLWHMEQSIEQHGPGVAIHILKDPDWKR